MIDLLLGSNNPIARDFIELNSLNSNGFTPLDVLLHFGGELEDAEIHQILREAGAVRTRDLDTRQAATTRTENETTQSE